MLAKRQYIFLRLFLSQIKGNALELNYLYRMIVINIMLGSFLLKKLKVSNIVFLD